MKKFITYLGATLLFFTFLYFIGSHPKKPELSPALPLVPESLSSLEGKICYDEGSLPIKKDNEARIIWANNTPHKKTKFSLVYLHGFSASQEEGSPLHQEFAKRYGCNLFLSRLAYHGLKDTNAFEKLTADSLFNSAKQALAIGKELGDSVILMATSAGGALALVLASEEQNIPIKGLILYSPCVKLFDPSAFILDKPWGLNIARLILKGKYIHGRKDSAGFKYWYPKYRIEGVIALQNLLDHTMNSSIFSKIHVPVLCLYYYKDKIHQDSVVSTKAIIEMFHTLGTPNNLKVLMPMPNVGDHVLACYLRSKDLNSVRSATFLFAEKQLGLKNLSN